MAEPSIRNTISTALEHEQSTGQFRQRLSEQLPELQRQLVLPEIEPLEALLAFITDYVESVPGCLNLVTAVSKRLGFYDYAAPFLRLAEDYFLQPPDVLPHASGLEALLDEAFLAHRLLEEVNDHHIRHLQRPLLPLDMTEANLIVHHLLGDELANRLEQLVQFTASNLLRQEHVWDRVQLSSGGSEEVSPKFNSNNLAGSPQQIRLRLSV